MRGLSVSIFLKIVLCCLLLACVIPLHAQFDPPIDEQKLAAEAALFSGSARVKIHVSVGSSEKLFHHRCAEIEAALEYCRANQLDMRTALPEFFREQLIIFAGSVSRPEIEHEKQNWCVVFRKSFSGDLAPMQICHLRPWPKNKKLVLKTTQQIFDYWPDVQIYSCKGVRDRGTSWPDHIGNDHLAVVLDQGRPFPGITLFVQTIGEYKILPDGLKLVSRFDHSIYHVNFNYRLLDRIVWDKPPSGDIVKEK